MIDAAEALPQWNRYTCGPAALRAALLCYGDRVDGRKLAALGDTNPQDGTDVPGMAAAAREFGFRFGHVLERDQSEAFALAYEYIRRGVPVLACVDGESHWVAAVRATTRHVWIVDPARDEDENLRRVTWRVFLRRVHWGLPDEIRFDFYPLEVCP